MGQAFTNIIKNGVEAIEQKIERDGAPTNGERHAIIMAINETMDGMIDVIVSDTGIGLPAERGRIVEPYMTTRRSGTGLGLAIVKKIAEDHGGSICFADRDGGGTVVTMNFNPAELRWRAESQDRIDAQADDTAPSNLTRVEGS